MNSLERTLLQENGSSATSPRRFPALLSASVLRQRLAGLHNEQSVIYFLSAEETEEILQCEPCDKVAITQVTMLSTIARIAKKVVPWKASPSSVTSSEHKDDFDQEHKSQGVFETVIDQTLSAMSDVNLHLATDDFQETQEEAVDNECNHLSWKTVSRSTTPEPHDAHSLQVKRQTHTEHDHFGAVSTPEPEYDSVAEKIYAAKVTVERTLEVPTDACTIPGQDGAFTQEKSEAQTEKHHLSTFTNLESEEDNASEKNHVSKVAIERTQNELFDACTVATRVPDDDCTQEKSHPTETLIERTQNELNRVSTVKAREANVGVSQEESWSVVTFKKKQNMVCTVATAYPNDDSAQDKSQIVEAGKKQPTNGHNSVSSVNPLHLLANYAATQASHPADSQHQTDTSAQNGSKRKSNQGIEVALDKKADFHDEIGLQLFQQGDFRGSLKEHKKASEKRRRGSLREAASYFNIGCALSKLGDSQGALSEHQNALNLRCRLAPFSIDTARSYAKVGILLHQKGDLAGALNNLRRSQSILCSVDSITMEMAALHVHVGAVLSKQENFDWALNSYRKSLAIVTRLAPGTASEAGAYKTIGVVLERRGKQGDLEGAVSNYRQALEIYEKTEPSSSNVTGMRNKIELLTRDCSTGGCNRTVTRMSSLLLAATHGQFPYESHDSQNDQVHLRGPQIQTESGMSSLLLAAQHDQLLDESHDLEDDRRGNEWGRRDQVESESAPYPMPETTQLDVRKSKRRRLLPLKYSRDDIVLDMKSHFSGRKEGKAAGDVSVRKRLSIASSPTADASDEALSRSKRPRKAHVTLLRDESIATVGSKQLHPNWTEEEDLMLIEGRERFGLSCNEISELIPGRTDGICAGRHHKLGRSTITREVVRPKENQGDPIVPVKPTADKAGGFKRFQPNWTEEEDLMLIDKRERFGLTFNEISELIPGRSKGACSGRYHKLGRSTNTCEVVRPRGNQRDSIVSVKPSADETGAPKQVQPNWTEEEDFILIDNREHFGLSFDEISEMIPGRTKGACAGRNHKLGRSMKTREVQGNPIVPVKPSAEPEVSYTSPSKGNRKNAYGTPCWTENEDVLLLEKRALGCYRWEQIARFFPGRSVGAVSGRWSRLKLSTPKAMQQKETRDSPVIPVPSSRDDVPVDGMAHSTAPRKVYQDWTDEEDAFMLSKRERCGLSWYEISDLMQGRSASACSTRFHKLMILGSKEARQKGTRGNAADRANPNYAGTDGNGFTPEEDAILRRKKACHIAYENIAEFLPGRSAGECRERFEELLHTKKKVPTIAKKIDLVSEHRQLQRSWSAFVAPPKKMSRIAHMPSLKAPPAAKKLSCIKKRALVLEKNASLSRRPRISHEDARLIKMARLTQYKVRME